MSAPANPLDQLVARAQESVRQADAAKAAKVKAKDGKAPQGVRDAATAEYHAWAESQAWRLVSKERAITRWVCKCGHIHDSEVVQFFAVYEHRVHIGAKREITCHKSDHASAPIRLRTLIRTTDYCTSCS